MTHLSSGHPSGSVPERGSPSAETRPLKGRRSRLLALLLPVVVLALAACQPQVWPVQVPYLNNADAAADWLVSDFETNGHNYTGGQLADTILALAATDADREAALPVVDALENTVVGYTQPSGNVNPGSTAKVLLAVQAARSDSNDFGGLDLEAALRSTMVSEGPTAGRFGTSNAFTQSMSILALDRTPTGIPTESAEWLSGTQCPSGAFSWGNCNFADADHTALSAQALIAAGGHQAEVQAAVDWLLDVQLTDGSFNAGSGAGNANSTGLSAPVLRATGHEAEAELAAQFIQGLQYGPEGGDKAGALRWMANLDSNLQLGTTQGVLAWGAGPYHQLAFPDVRGHGCADDDGVTVIVDLARFDNTIRMACAEGLQATGWAALESAGFTVGSVPGFEGAAICTIDDLPTEGFPTCWNEGFWGYFHDENRTGEWEFSNMGASYRTPPPGSVEGWRYEPSWAARTAVAPGINPLWAATCATPLADLDESAEHPTLRLTGPWGAGVEVATANGTEPVSWDLLMSLYWSTTSTINLDDTTPTRVFARSADPDCDRVGTYHALHQPQDAVPITTLAEP